MPKVIHKPNVVYKYNIRHRFSLLMDHSITWEKIQKHLEVNCDISARTFERDRDLLIDDQSDMTTTRLVHYAKVLQCKVTDLINYNSIAKPFKK